jgi:HSP20 family protein
MRHNRERSILPLIDSLLSGLITEGNSILYALPSLPMNVFFKEGAYHFRGPLPGVSLEDVQVWVENNCLFVKGEIKPDIDLEEARVYRREVRSGNFERSWKLPQNADTDRVQASLKNGILDITIPVVDQPDNRIKTIPINSD